MGTRPLLTAVAATFAVAWFHGAPANLDAQGAAALSGAVSSAQEGKMEGVVVTARRDGANFTVSVVSDAQGRYSFPRSHVQPGRYALTMRAVGYDLTDPGPVQVAADKATVVDLQLQKARDLASQLSSLEWTMSMPGTTEQKDKLVYQALSCAYCHTYQRIMKSKHTAEQWLPVITRMQTYYPDGTASSDDGRGRGQRGEPANVAAAPKNPNWGTMPKTELAAYLATVNLSGGRTTWPFELKTLPRPKGKATRIIVTQWDMPRKDTVPHDLEVDSKGVPWYTDESRQMLGKFDAATNTFTEYPLPAIPPGVLPGARDVTVDRQDNIWFPLRNETGHATPARFDPKTQKVVTLDLPDKDISVQFVATGPDGRIWMKGGGAGPLYRIDPTTLKVEKFDYLKTPGLPEGRHSAYMVVVDSKGNGWLTGNSTLYIIRVDAVTGAAKFFETPTRNAYPRRGRIDGQDRFWFAEYFGDRLAMFDTRSEKFQEWPTAVKYTTPYTMSAPDRNGYVYASTNMSERLLRLDPKSGEIIEYQMPTNFDTKKMALGLGTSGATLWMANTRNARLVRVEPLD